MRFERVMLTAGDPGAVRGFYVERLGLSLLEEGALRIGESVLEFAPGEGAPFYHFAFLIPGDRFPAALEWARHRVELLGDGVYDFPAWNAQACYFHDPAGSIVELIAHRAIGSRGAAGAFSPNELLGLSELGLVGDIAAMAEALQTELGLEVWDGTVTGSLAFVGEQARTLILAGEGRGWLPTGRPSEAYPAAAVLAGGTPGNARLEGGRYRVAVI